MYFPYDLLNNIFSLADFRVRIWYTIHTTYKICIGRLFLIFLINNRLLVVKFGGSQRS